MSACGACGIALDSQMRFCPECGTPRQPTACPSCGAESVGGKFCAQCGTPLGGAPAAPPAPDPVERVSERRLTSILFADLVGFTPLSEARDPEEVRELLSRYFDRSRTVVTRYGGTVEKFIGDAVMAVWGVPIAHEDDAERAVRAGLELVAVVTELGDELGAPGLKLRVGITTGEVAVTVGATGEGMVAGDAVNTAARVQARAEPGAVWVDRSTRDLAAAAIDFADAGLHELKGKAAPVELHAARSVVAVVGGGQRADELEPPFVGRDRQLRLVKELLHGTVDDRRPRLVLVSGPAGVGKSRVAWEFEKYIDGLNDVFAWHRGRCRAYGDGGAFRALSEIVRLRLDVGDGEAPDTAIQERLPRFLPDTEERSWVGPRLKALIGATERSAFEQDDLFAAWTRFVERAGTGSPVVVVLEDLQLADAGLLDFLEHLLATAGEAILVLGLARPELLERRQELLTNRRVSVVHLEPLPDNVMGDLVGGVVDGLTDHVRTTLIERAEGIPLYAVETVRALMDRGQVVRENGGYRLADGRVDLEAIGAPASLHALIASRLDALPPDERRVVAHASVLGMSFTPTALAGLTGSENVRDVVDRLVRRDMFTVQSDRFAADRGRLRFVQAVVRQVAYGTLSRRDRRLAHLAAAAHLEDEDATEELGPVIAHHLLDAVSASAEGDADAEALTDRAIALLTASADRALDLGAVDEALRHLEIAHDRCTDPSQQLAVKEAIAHAAVKAGHFDLCIAHANEVLAATGDDPIRAAAVAAAAGEAHMGTNHAEAAIAVLEPRLAALGDDEASQRAAVAILTQLARAHDFLGHRELASACSTRQLEVGERLGDVTVVCTALVGMGIVWMTAGRPRGAAALMRAAADIARRTGQVTLLVRALLNTAAILTSEDLEEALTVSEEAVDLSGRAHADYRLYAYLTRCVCLYVAGSWSEAREMIGRTQDEHESSSIPAAPAISEWLTQASSPEPPPADPHATVGQEATTESALHAWNWQRRINAARGRGDHAALAAASASALAASIDAFDFGDDFAIVWPHIVAASLDAGALDQAAEQIEQIATAPRGLVPPLLRAQLHRFQGLLAAARGEDPEAALRAGIEALDAFGAKPDAARTRQALAEWLTAQGREDEAAELLAAARAVYEEIGAAGWIAGLSELPVALASERG